MSDTPRNTFSGLEFVATTAASCVLAALALKACLTLASAPTYADFVVGSITWQAGSKLQDLAAVPVFIATWFAGAFSLASLLGWWKRLFGNARAEQLAAQLLWWSVPAWAALLGLAVGTPADERLFWVSALGVVLVALLGAQSARKNLEADPAVSSLGLLLALLVGLWPLEIALVSGRLPTSLVGETEFSWAGKVTLACMGLCAGLVAFVSARSPSPLARHLPKLALAAGLGLPLLFCALFPAPLRQPDGSLTAYETTPWLEVLLAVMITGGVLEAVFRYRKYAGAGGLRLLSPIGVAALLVALRAGQTEAPNLNPDDYHFGETLLGWWSYTRGAIPYVGYMPPHGLIDDDLSRFLTSVFYDGTAASMAEAARLGFALTACGAFAAMYVFSGSLPLASATFLMSGRMSWMFLAAFLCLWTLGSLRARPTRWLTVWLLTVPLLILAVPPQGLLLAAATAGIAASFAFRLWRHPEERRRELLVGPTVLLVLAVATPLVPMLWGATRYVLENGSINQVAYGIAWADSWTYSGKAGLGFELVRMSWVLVPLLCLGLLAVGLRDPHRERVTLLPTLAVLVFSLLLIPYSMGRIDPGSASRAGMVAGFGWAVLMPVAAWEFLAPERRSWLAAVACLGATLNVAPLSLKGLLSVAASPVATGALVDAPSAGLAHVGKTAIDGTHWDRLTRLNAVLNERLEPQETYLDLTSRNAQYFYLNRLPPIPVTAVFNLAPPAQQRRAVELLSLKLPRLALLEGDNIVHDGGGLALRTHALYRFVLDRYTPTLDRGFIVGTPRREGNPPEPIVVAIKDLTDENWEHGLNRREAAVIVADPSLMPLLRVGQLVHWGTGEPRHVSRVWLEGSAIWLDGPPMAEAPPPRLTLELSAELDAEYRLSLFQRAFGPAGLQKIPVAWGRSESSLLRRMDLVRSLDGVVPVPTSLVPEPGRYRVAGADPTLVFDLSGLGLSGRDAGLLRLEFSCPGASTDLQLQLQVFWWGDGQVGPTEEASLTFTGENGVLIVPLDANPRWLATKHLTSLRFDLNSASACPTFSLGNLGLFQRRL